MILYYWSYNSLTQRREIKFIITVTHLHILNKYYYNIHSSWSVRLGLLINSGLTFYSVI